MAKQNVLGLLYYGRPQWSLWHPQFLLLNNDLVKIQLSINFLKQSAGSGPSAQWIKTNSVQWLQYSFIIHFLSSAAHSHFALLSNCDNHVRIQLFANFEKFLSKGRRAILNFRKFKVALKPSKEFFKTLQSVASYHANYNFRIKCGSQMHQAVF